MLECAYRLTMFRPPHSAISRTASASSARPSSKNGRQRSMYGSKRSPSATGRYIHMPMAPSRTLAFLSAQRDSISGSRPSSASSPSAQHTSARPCAAPVRSTDDTSLDSAESSHSKRSGKASWPTPSSSEPSALAAVARTSGMGSSTAFRSSGEMLSRYGSRPLLSVTSAVMLPTTPQALSSGLRSRMPRQSTGTMSASDAGSTLLTKTVRNSESRHLAVFSAGFAMAEMSVDTSAATSGLRMTPPISLRATLAALDTFSCVSCSASASLGTIFGSAAPSCLGARCAIEPSSWQEPCLVRHASSSRPFRSEGMTSLTPCALSLAMMACAAPREASRTDFMPSPRHVRMSGITCMTYGSNSLPKLSESAWIANMEPSRPMLALLSVSAAAALMASMMPCAFSALIPRPLTAPAMPKAAPLRSANFELFRSIFSRSAVISFDLSVSAGMSGGRQAATERWTDSEGVVSTSSSRCAISTTRGSPFGRCLASAPSKTVTPSRTTSYISTLMPSAWPACVKRSNMGSNALAPSDPPASITATPASIIRARTPSSASLSPRPRRKAATTGSSAGPMSVARLVSASAVPRRADTNPPPCCV